MFRPVDTAAGEGSLRMTFQGETITAHPGDTVAMALVAAGILVWRETPRTGSPRGPYCMMGACFDCMVVIDGQANRQACMTPAVDGMVITRQTGAGE